MMSLRVPALLLLATLTSAQVDLHDLTLQPGTHGQAVVEATVASIFDKCVFKDDFRFLRRLAYVMTNDGNNAGTYQAGNSTGGIWKVTQAQFNATKTLQAYFNTHYPGITAAFNISWPSVQYSDLDKPLYSALAALMTIIGYTSDAPQVSVAAQATVYGQVLGGLYNDYVRGVNTLEQYVKACNTQLLDLAFILDASGSVDPADFNRSKSFASAIVDSFTVAPDRVRVAALTYSSGVREEFDFTSHLSTTAVKAAISAISQSNGGTATFLALDYASSTLFTTSSGSRNNTAKVAVVITDGTSFNSTLTSEAAARLKANNVEVYVFGIGQTLYVQELNAMASPPHCTHVKVVSQFSDLISIKSDIIRRSCDAAVLQPVNTRVNYTCGVQQTIKIIPGPETTIKITPTDGQVMVYASFDSSQPNAAKYLLSHVATKYRPLVIYLKNTTAPLHLTLDTTGQCNGSVSLDVTSGTTDLSKLGYTTMCVINKVLVPCPDWVFLHNCRLFPIIHGDVAGLSYPNPCKPNQQEYFTYPFSIYWYVYCTGNNTLLECKCPPGERYSGYASNCIPIYTLDPSDPCTACDQGNWDLGLHRLHLAWDASKYVQCTGVYSCNVVSCGTNNRFDQTTGTCIIGATTATATTSTTTTSTTTTTPRPTLSTVHCETGPNAQTYFPYLNHPTKYIHCESGTAYVLDCPMGTTWNQGVIRCE